MARPPKKAVDQLLEDRQCDASKPRKVTVANYVLGQRIMCPSNIALEPKIYFKLFITHYFYTSDLCPKIQLDTFNLNAKMSLTF